MAKKITFKRDTVETVLSIKGYLIDAALLSIYNAKSEGEKEWYVKRIEAYKKDMGFWDGILQRNHYTRRA